MRILLFLFLILIKTHAADFTPESAAAYAVRENKDLAAARELIAEAEGRLVQAGLWNNPELELRTEIGVNRSDGSRLYEAGFMQRFPWSGRLARARAVARVDVAMALEELRDKERLLAGEVLGKGRALLVIDRNLMLNQENRELLSRIMKQTNTLAAAGEASAAEARVIELETVTLELAHEALVITRQSKLAELNGLLGRDPEDMLRMAGTLPSPPDAATLRAGASMAVANRPDRRLVALQIDKAQSERLLAVAERWEDVGARVGVTRERDDGMYETMVGVAISVPLPLWNRNQGRIAETQAAQRRAAAEVAALDLAIATEVKEAQARVAGLAQVLSKTRGPALELARNTTKLLEETYATGTTSFLAIFESRKQRLAIEQAAIDTQEQLAEAITEWETRSVRFPKAVQAALEAKNGR